LARTIHISQVFRTESFPVFEPPMLAACVPSPGSAEFHTMLLQMQRDENVISDHEMAIAEGVLYSRPQRGEHPVRFNPFTGEYNDEGLGI